MLRIPYDRLDQFMTERPHFGVSVYRGTRGFLTGHLRRLVLELNVDMNRRFLQLLHPTPAS